MLVIAMRTPVFSATIPNCDVNISRQQQKKEKIMPLPPECEQALSEARADATVDIYL